MKKSMNKNLKIANFKPSDRNFGYSDDNGETMHYYPTTKKLTDIKPEIEGFVFMEEDILKMADALDEVNFKILSNTIFIVKPNSEYIVDAQNQEYKLSDFGDHLAECHVHVYQLDKLLNGFSKMKHTIANDEYEIKIFNIETVRNSN